MMELPQKARHYLNVMNHSAQLGLTLVKDILTSSRLEVSEYELVLNEHDFVQYISYFEYTLSLLAQSKNIFFSINYLTDQVMVNLNSEKFSQVINNLVSNSIKFTSREGKIELSVNKVRIKNQTYAEMCIKDSGIGIEKDQLPLLFDKFTRAGRKGTEGESSTGLGLSIVKRIVELHHGMIEVESEVGVGTLFKVTLPAL